MRIHSTRFGQGVAVLAIGCTLAQAQDVAEPSKTSPEVTLDDLQEMTIRATNNFTGRFSNKWGDAPGGFTVRSEIRIGPGTHLELKGARDAWWDSPAGRMTGHNKSSGAWGIGVPGQMKDGQQTLWLFETNTLTQLRVLEVGAVTLRIIFEKGAAGLGCSAVASIAQEVGAGPTTNKPLLQGGGLVQSLSATPTSSTCKVLATAKVKDDDGFWAKAAPSGGVRSFDGVWMVTWTRGPNCGGNSGGGTFRVPIANGIARGKDLSGTISVAGAVGWNTSAGTDGAPIRYRGTFRGNSGSGTFERPDGKCSGTFIARRN